MQDMLLRNHATYNISEITIDASRTLYLLRIPLPYVVGNRIPLPSENGTGPKESTGSINCYVIADHHNQTFTLVDTADNDEIGKKAFFAAVTDVIQKHSTYTFSNCFISHLHPDHYGNMKELAVRFPQLQFYISEEARPLMQNTAKWHDAHKKEIIAGYRHMGIAKDALHSYYTHAKEEMIQRIPDPATLEGRINYLTPEQGVLGGRVIYLPGHSSNQMGLIIENILLSADAAFCVRDGNKRPEEMGRRTVPFPARFGEDDKQGIAPLLQSLARLYLLCREQNMVMYPSHWDVMEQPCPCIEGIVESYNHFSITLQNILAAKQVPVSAVELVRDSDELWMNLFKSVLREHDKITGIVYLYTFSMLEFLTEKGILKRNEDDGVLKYVFHSQNNEVISDFFRENMPKL
ncbi:MBL fold metallo-hydrolase [Candidatus Woesearchaeota archaeon]|nr:MBL fold metallo-hydrolase [Candidatus Woesearchaeota archaeon]